MIKAVIFDFGRVISAPKPMSLFEQYEDDLGLARGMINPIMFETPSWDRVLLGKMSLDDYWAEIAPLLGLKSSEEISAFRARYRADERINTPVMEVIRSLRGRVKLAVLSNAPKGLIEWMEDWEILGLFDVVICSADEGVVKPEPAAFQLALDRLGVAASESVFIDDTLGHVGASRQLGMYAIHYTLATDLEARLNDVFAAAKEKEP